MANIARDRVRVRLIPYLALFLLCGSSALPVLGLQKKDSFPVSTYPMFAGHRGQPTFHRLVAVWGDGARKIVPPQLVASGEVLQTKVIITRAVKRGRKAMRRLCQEVAENISQETEFTAAKALQLEEVRFDSIRYFTETQRPIYSKLLRQCPIHGEVRP